MNTWGNVNPSNPSLWRLLSERLGGQKGGVRSLLADLKDFLVESTPHRRRLRYGDIDFDFDKRVNTTAATVTWKGRLLGAVAGGPYQPCDAELFHRTISELKIDYSKFTFLDIGSGKGRALLLASDYPFHKIVGVELVPELNRVAHQNIQEYQSDTQQCFNVESVCMDATAYEFPSDQLLLFLFNPVPESALKKVVANLERSMEEHPRAVNVVYHNPVLMHLFANSPKFYTVGGDLRTATFRSR